MKQCREGKRSGTHVEHTPLSRHWKKPWLNDSTMKSDACQWNTALLMIRTLQKSWCSKMWILWILWIWESKSCICQRICIFPGCHESFGIKGGVGSSVGFPRMTLGWLQYHFSSSGWWFGTLFVFPYIGPPTSHVSCLSHGKSRWIPFLPSLSRQTYLIYQRGQ